MKSSVLRCCRHCIAFSLVIFLILCLQASLFAVQSSQQASRGPQIYVQDSQAIKVNHTGNSSAVQALAAGNAQPLSSTSADIDEDGVADLLAGYSTPAGGVVVLHRGNLDAFAPQSNQSFLAIAHGNFPAPFLPDARVFNVPIRPDFITTGHFIGSGHLDLVIASRGGNALYVFPGNGKGKFTNPQVVQLSGGVSALAAGDLGKSGPFSNLVIGLSNKQNSSLTVFRGGMSGLAQLASYKLTAPVSSIAFGDLDGDRHPDVAVLSGGQVQILHSSSMKLEGTSLPVSAVAMTLGSFIHDRGLRLQIALLAADGSLHIAAPGSFDSRAFTLDEAKAMRLASLRRQPNPVVPLQAAAFNEAWNIVESFSAVAPFGASGVTPVLLRARISSQATDDVMVFNPAASQMAVISHTNVQAGATSFTPGAVSVRSYSGSPVAAVSARVNVDGRPGVILLHDGHVGPFVMMPVPDPTFMVNTTADTVTANGCAPANPNTCSLREAIIEANASAGSDTIMVPAGTYQLTIAPAAGADPHDATTGDLDITDAVSIVGANSATTIVEAGTSAGTGIDKIFSINPQGVGAGFDTSISNLTLRFGTNPSAAGTGDQFGGALDWSAGFDGAGNLTITSCVITDNNTTDGDGGGLSLSNPGGSGVATISNSTIQNNAANTATTGNGGIGGGILVGSFTSLTLTNSQLLNNQATQVTGAMGKGGAINLGAFSHSNIHSSTISGNQAAGDGGGIWSNQGLTIDQGSVITSNAAVAGSGGGLWSDNQDVDVTSLTKVTITGNSAAGNGGGIHIDATSPQVVHLNFSRIVGNSAAAGTGLDNINGTVDATDSWWGCNQGPSTAPCDTINDPNLGVTFDPFIVLSHTANPAAIAVGNNTTLTASFLQDNHGTAIAVGNLSVLIGLPIQFNNPILGTLSNQQTSIQSSATATATYTATAAGAGHADAIVDSATVTANITNVGPPSIAKAFGAANILLSASTSLTFTITNTNPVALTGVAFTDSLPSGLVVSTPNGVTGSCGGGTITATAGSGSVSLAGGTVAASGSCMFSVNVTGTTTGNKVNTTGAVTSANGGSGNTATASIVVLDRPDLTITKTHTGNFNPGQVGATYTITVSNVGTGATVGTVTVVDTLPTGLTATNIAGTGWACVLNTLTCTRADVLNGGASYPAITLTVNVASNVGGTVTNTATVSGGGELNTTNDTASDPTHTGSAALQITTNGGNLTVTAGSSTSTTFTVDAASGLGTITFSCSGLPAGATCSFNPPSENQISATVTMTVSTTAGSVALNPLGNSNTPIYAVLLPVLGLAGLTFRGKKGKAARLRLALLLGGLMMLFALVSCGGRSNQVSGTPAGTFPFSVTATSGTTSASATVNLTVLSPGPQH